MSGAPGHTAAMVRQGYDRGYTEGAEQGRSEERGAAVKALHDLAGAYQGHSPEWAHALLHAARTIQARPPGGPPMARIVPAFPLEPDDDEYDQ